MTHTHAHTHIHTHTHTHTHTYTRTHTHTHVHKHTNTHTNTNTHTQTCSYTARTHAHKQTQTHTPTRTQEGHATLNRLMSFLLLHKKQPISFAGISICSAHTSGSRGHQTEMDPSLWGSTCYLTYTTGTHTQTQTQTHTHTLFPLVLIPASTSPIQENRCPELRWGLRPPLFSIDLVSQNRGSVMYSRSQVGVVSWLIDVAFITS